MTGSRKRFYREDWLDLGLKLLSADGPDALRVDRICAEAGVTKGSFYHHFEDLSSFLIALAKQWRVLYTDIFVEQFNPATLTDTQLAALIEEALEIDIHLELNIRELAKRDDRIAALLAETETARLAFVAEVYKSRFGVDEETARDLSLLDYGAFSGIVLLNPDISIDERRRIYLLFDELLRARFQPATERPDGTV
ncbi:TetR family transcriptional regulator [Roseobacter sp. HKCCD9010]|uniref:TetR/AcrR family transcriptional regulator n=1 Tax=unclassified Roseobacter TaxID=196798 RepID=UPI001490A4BF|nr:MULTISPECIES: TetR/AcrR family transcriptional regulator [unclassified Roseobacter]MBF9049607.1 TetR family transcriptional regulator [Rhodobacterales bacterium HKCCD4356]NNV11607.1 TetR family transcriptional regulator [Roseobacter sp. HKCCD7357]NNV15791.1 TetR family transcriptional regulator [Roseobacter sp. HKCCD8768]NNV25251.1 TetR family transcriptional regulator [Roseobacter sp. HKCCD8192]NNV29508.1 TetR family transcriptional regulator [Roseobacter sp. HKCCD9061]